jgi:hypothetical protein
LSSSNIDDTEESQECNQGLSNLVKQRRKEELPVVVPEHHLNGGHLYSIVHDPHMKGCTFEMHSSNKGTQVHPAVLSWLAKNWKRLCPPTTAA